MKIIKISALLLLVCTLLSALCSCGGSGTPADTSAGDATADTAPFKKTGETYDDATFFILLGSQAGDAFNDFKFAEENVTILDEAIKAKNAKVEEEFGVVINYEEKFKSSEAYNLAVESFGSNTHIYDLAMIAGYDIVQLGYGGYLYDLNSMDYLDVTHEWWDQNANAEFAVADKLYYTTGDISIQDDLQQFCIAFNKGMYEQQGYDTSLYTLIEEDKWTFDKLYEYARNVTADFDGDGVMNMNDKYGILTWDDSIYGVFSAGGTKILNTEDGEIKMTFSGDEKVFTALVNYTEQIKSIGINYSQRWDEGAGDAAIKMFTEDRALFLFGRISSFNSFRDMETNYGILPYPKLSEEQDRYYTILSGYHANYTCMINLPTNIEMRGEVTEALAYYSQQLLTPAFREKTLKGVHVRDDESIVSLEIMADSRIYDLGYMLRPGKIDAQLIYLFRELDTTYASTFAKYTILAKNDIKKANEGFAEVAAK